MAFALELSGKSGRFRQLSRLLEDIEPELAQASISLISGETNFSSMASAILLSNIAISAQKRVRDAYAGKFLLY
jgi:hypothetical protein